MSQLLTKVVDNIQFILSNVHIRFEDKYSYSSSPISLGITISNLKIVSSDSQWSEAFSQGENTIIYKILDLQDFSIYHLTDSTLISNLSEEELIEYFCNWNHSMVDQFLVRPVRAVGKLQLCKIPMGSLPNYSISMEIDELGFSLDDDQYKSFFSIVDSGRMYLKSQNYLRFRPPKTITPNLDPKAWFLYASKCVLSEIHKKNRTWSWSYFKERRDDRKRYIKLFKSKALGSVMVASDSLLLLNLEKKLAFEDLRFYRSLARVEIRKEKLSAPTTAPPAQNSWLSGFWGYTTSSQQTSEGKTDSPMITQEDLKKLYETIDYRPEDISKRDWPQDIPILDINWSLKKGFFAVSRKVQNDVEDFIRCEYRNIQINLKNYANSVKLLATIEDISAKDSSSTHDPRYPLIIYRKNVDENPFFFNLQFESNPADNHADSVLNVEISPVEYVANVRTMKSLFKFFDPPTSDLDSVALIASAAQSAIQQLSNQTRAGLEYAIENHKTLDLRLHIGSPTFIFPLKNNQGRLLLDAGDFGIESQLVDKSLLATYQGEKNIEIAAFEEMLYDKFKITLNQMSLVFDYYENEQKSSSIIQDISLVLLLQMCILPKRTQFTKVKLDANLPEIALSLSSEQFRAISGLFGDFNLVLSHVQDAMNSPISPKTEFSYSSKGDPSLYDDFFDAEENSVIEVSLNEIVPNENDANTAKIFDMTFELDSVRLVLKKCSDSEMPSLVCLSISSICLQFGQYPQKTLGSLSIGSCNIESSNSELPMYLMKTVPSNLQRKNLLTVIFSTEYLLNGQSSLINLDFSKTELNLHSKYLIDLYEYFLDLGLGNEESLSAVSGITSPTTMKSGAAVATSNRLKIASRIDHISLRLISTENIEVASIEFNSGELNFDFDNDDFLIEGNMNGLEIFSDFKRKRKVKIFSGLDDAMTKFTLKGLPRQDSFKNELEVDFGSVKMCYFDEILKETMNYFKELQRLHFLMESARHAATQSAIVIQENAVFLKYKISISTPILEFNLQNEDKIQVYLAEVVAFNSSVSTNLPAMSTNSHKFSIRNMNIMFIEGDAPEKILQDLNISFEIFSANLLKSQALDIPLTFVSGTMSPLHLLATKTQYNTLMELITKIMVLFSSDPNAVANVPITDSNTFVSFEMNIDCDEFLFSLKNPLKEVFCVPRLSNLRICAKLDSLSNLKIELLSKKYQAFDIKSNSIFLRPNFNNNPLLIQILMTGASTKYIVYFDECEMNFEWISIFQIQDFFTNPMPKIQSEKDLPDIEYQVILSSSQFSLQQDYYALVFEPQLTRIVLKGLSLKLSMKEIESKLNIDSHLQSYSLSLFKEGGLVYTSVLSLPSMTTVTNLNFNPVSCQLEFKSVNIINLILSKSLERIIQAQQVVVSHYPANLVTRIGSQRYIAAANDLSIILIDDLSDIKLPLFKINFINSSVESLDWKNMSSGAKISVDSFNLKNSHWEPVIETWQFNTNVLWEEITQVDLFSKQKCELNLTYSFIESFVSSLRKLGVENTLKSNIYKSEDSPYIIRNRCGYSFHIWAETSCDGMETILQSVENGQYLKWAFGTHASSLRLNGSSLSKNRLCIQINGPSWESLRNIPVDNEGQKMYMLRPKIRKVSHYLICKIELKDKVKIVTFQSCFSIRNDTGFDVELGFVRPDEDSTYRHEIIKSKSDYFIPIEEAYNSSFVIRPYAFMYKFSSEMFNFKNLSRHINEYLMANCASSDPQALPSFILGIVCNYQIPQKKNLTKSSQSLEYPNIQLKIQPPMILENALPFRIKYFLKDKSSNYDEKDWIDARDSKDLHLIHPFGILALAVDIPDTGHKARSFSILHDKNSDYQDDILHLEDSEKRKLALRLNYSEENQNIRITIYSPYIIMNKTGLLLRIQNGSDNCIFPVKHDAGPFMYSYNSEGLRNRSLICVGDSDWSKGLSLDAVGSSFHASVSSTRRNCIYHMGIEIHEYSYFYLTKVVTFNPRFVLVNQSNETLEFKRKGSSSINISEASNTQIVHYLYPDCEELSIRLKDAEQEWSSFVKLNQVGRIYLKISSLNSLNESLLRIEVVLQGSCLFVLINIEKQHWPFRIENALDVDVGISQLHCPKKYLVNRHSNRNYAWDSPSDSNKTLIVQIKDKTREIDLLDIGHQLPFKYMTEEKNIKIIDIHTFADGPTIVLRLSFLESENFDANPSSTIAEEKIQTIVRIKFDEIGLSLITESVKELCYFTVKGLEFFCKLTDKTQYYELITRWIQIDNCLAGSLSPIALYPTLIKFEQATVSTEESRPVLLARLAKSNDDSFGVDYNHIFTVLLQEFSLDIDEDFLIEILEFSRITMGQSSGSDAVDQLSTELVIPKYEEGDRKMYFETFLLHPIQLNLSFSRTGSTRDPNETKRQNLASFIFKAFTMTVGNVHEAPLRTNALELYHPIVTWGQMTDLIVKFYSQEVINQFHKIIGSADVLGNPVGLFNNVASGVTDLFYEPIQGFEITRPQDFGIGIAKGTASFFKKTVYGVSDTFSRFTGSVGKGLSVITMDQEFQDQRKISKIRNRPNHAISGVAQGAASLAKSVASGISGVVSKPIEGAEKDGLGGFFKGLGKGIVGAVAKPVIGIFDLASNVSEGIKNTTTVFDAEIDRTRVPRHIGKDGVLKPYDAREALGSHWLLTIENGKYKNEDYIAHLDLRQDERTALITDQRILLFRIKKLIVLYDISFESLEKVLLNGRMVSLSCGDYMPTIACPDADTAKWLSSKIEESFSEFLALNKKSD